MGVEMSVFLTFGGAMILVFLLGRALLVPLKYILKLTLNSIVGGILLMVLNFVGMHIGIAVPLNLVNAVTVGVLGLPGVILLVILCN